MFRRQRITKKCYITNKRIQPLAVGYQNFTMFVRHISGKVAPDLPALYANSDDISISLEYVL